MKLTDIPTAEITQELLKMRESREWEQFHALKNLAISLVIEAAEVVEIFQWSDLNEELSAEKKAHLAEELSDVLNWVLLIAHDAEIDLGQAALDKIEKNNAKYPVEKSKGNTKKYTDL
jgi:NTP pyrophosphatase (non-canonical NTP hydrolase)